MNTQRRMRRREAWVVCSGMRCRKPDKSGRRIHYLPTLPSRRGHGHGETIHQSIIISGSERTERPDVAAAAVSDLWRKRSFDVRHTSFTSGVATVACQQRCPVPVSLCILLLLLYLLWYNSSAATCYINIPPRRSNQPPRRFSEITKYNPLALTASMQHSTPNPRLQPSSPLPPLPLSLSPTLPLVPPPL
jgi:hypothetical protein